MGSGSSKPEATPNTHVWNSDAPVRFSQQMVDSLQTSSETDSTRAKTLELHIQTRVASELQKLQEKAVADYSAMQDKLSSVEETVVPKSEEQSAGDALRQLGREQVQNEVQSLRKKLEQRKTVQQVDEGVEKAKSAVIRCLRENDRRPLDCYQEVQAFKNEVRRLEGGWVEKIVN